GVFNGVGSRKRTIKRHSPTPLFSLTDPSDSVYLDVKAFGRLYIWKSCWQNSVSDAITTQQGINRRCKRLTPPV
ncbi:hypothetical protein, partial [Serratia marcescens]|uniref:hypothetical protein n=1 Tax=Serratia marcescens TaxID=615 RepID=UPI001C647068